MVVIGDGSSDPVTFSGDKLNSAAGLIKAGAEMALPDTIKESRKILGDKLFE